MITKLVAVITRMITNRKEHQKKIFWLVKHKNKLSAPDNSWDKEKFTFQLSTMNFAFCCLMMNARFIIFSRCRPSQPLLRLVRTLRLQLQLQLSKQSMLYGIK